MTQTNVPPRQNKRLVARRLTLLGSAAALSSAILLAGVPAVPLPVSGGAAHAAALASQPAGFADLVAKVKPAVISVRVKLDEQITGTNGQASPSEPGAPLEKFFRQFGLPGQRPSTGHRFITGEGSGFLVSQDGYAVTNCHVVDHSTSVQVTTDAGKVYTAKVIGTDQKTDLALIKIDGDNFPYVRFSDHAPRIGDWVVAVGNPFGLGGTVTAGIVSARGRDIGAGPYDDFIQIDAPINKGNSGGPAFDVDGNVIGVNTAIFSPSGGSVGIGFDIPARTAKWVVSQLKDKGSVTRGWLGVQIQPITADIADSLGLKSTDGALVAEPQSGSPAAKAGVAAGDVITAVNGEQIASAHELARKIATMAPGSSVNVSVLRKGEQKNLAVTLGQLPDQQHQANASSSGGEQPGIPHLGLTLSPANDVAGSGDKGVAVTAVEPDGPAAEHGFRVGDVILDVAGKVVSTPADIRKELGELQKGGKRSVLMRVKSGDATRFIALPLGNA